VAARWRPLTPGGATAARDGIRGLAVRRPGAACGIASPARRTRNWPLSVSGWAPSGKATNADAVNSTPHFLSIQISWEPLLHKRPPAPGAFDTAGITRITREPSDDSLAALSFDFSSPHTFPIELNFLGLLASQIAQSTFPISSVKIRRVIDSAEAITYEFPAEQVGSFSHIDHAIES
jgi:hypothetical protein